MTSVCRGFFVARIDEVLMNRVRRRPRVIAKRRAYQRCTRAVPACCADRRQEMPICRHFGEALFRTRTVDPLLTMEVLFEFGRSEEVRLPPSFARTYAIRPLGASLSSKVPEPSCGAPNLSPRLIPKPSGEPGSLGRNELVGNRGQDEGLSRRISATRAGCSRAAKCPV
jgi:hypothetical protein